VSSKFPVPVRARGPSEPRAPYYGAPSNIARLFSLASRAVLVNKFIRAISRYFAVSFFLNHLALITHGLPLTHMQ
jgi:hypothetical protein